MNIYFGKADHTPSRNHIYRVPISSLSFQPQIPFDERDQRRSSCWRLLTSGGSSIAVWEIQVESATKTTVDSVENTRTAINSENVPTMDEEYLEEGQGKAETLQQGSSQVVRWLHARPCDGKVQMRKEFSATDHAPAYVVRACWCPNGNKFASADGRQILLWEWKESSKINNIDGSSNLSWMRTGVFAESRELRTIRVSF